LSRIDGKFTSAGEIPLDLADLLAVLEAQPETNARDWRQAIACYLAAGDGWRDASQLLGGAFATGPAEAVRTGDEET
jgi:hypothetical protein